MKERVGAAMRLTAETVDPPRYAQIFFDCFSNKIQFYFLERMRE